MAAVATEPPLALHRVVTDSLFENTPRESIDLSKGKTAPEASPLFLQQVHDAITKSISRDQNTLGVPAIKRHTAIVVDSSMPTPGLTQAPTPADTPADAMSLACRRLSIEVAAPEAAVEPEAELAPPAVNLLRQINGLFHTDKTEAEEITAAAPPAAQLLKQINQAFRSKEYDTAAPIDAAAPPAAHLLQQINHALSFSHRASKRAQKSRALAVETEEPHAPVYFLRQINDFIRGH